MTEKLSEKTLTDEQVAELEKANGEIVVVKTKVGPCAFRVPRKKEYDRYKATLFKDATRSMAPEMLVKMTVVYPSAQDFESLVDKAPGIVETCIGPVLELAGVNAEAEVKKSETASGTI
jgi:hypothetical protein